jgi:hypothetical protein
MWFSHDAYDYTGHDQPLFRKFQCFRSLVAKPNPLENHLFLANVTMSAAVPDLRCEASEQ